MTRAAHLTCRLLNERRAAAARPCAAAAFVVAVCMGLGAGPTTNAQSAPDCRIVSVHPLPEIPMPVAGNRPAVLLGGLSDLTLPQASSTESGGISAQHHSPGRLSLWAITDRGPNGTLETPAGKRRTLLDRDFVPSIVHLEVDVADVGTDPQSDAPEAARVTDVLQLTNASGGPLSGRPNGVGRDEPILDPRDATAIPPDPDGIDSEGLVRMRDGSFWVAEEYRPSLLQVSAEGRAVARFVPVGQSIPGAGMDVHEVLPEAYGARRDNRGFEALAVSPDQSRLWLLLQSPLEHPVTKAAKVSGNVRLLAFDVAARRPAAEYVYRLGDPKAEGFLGRGAAPEDGKLCAIAAIDDTSLLVLEQADGGLARLYACSLANATDTLDRPASSSTQPVELEQVVDLPAAGIRPVAKQLVADLAPLLPRMAHDVYRIRAEGTPSLKLEGMAIVDARHIVIVNDNDFGVHGDGKKPDDEGRKSSTPRTCLWTLELATPLWPETPGRTARAP